MGIHMQSIISMTFGLLLTATPQLFAQSVAQPGHECSFNYRMVTLNCINPDSGTDIRLSVSEFQECKDGKISKLDKSNFGIVLSEPNDDSAGWQTSVQYSSKRTHMDDRDGDETMVLPVSAEIKSSNSVYKIDITENTEPDFEGSTDTERHYIGSFKGFSKTGAPTSSGKFDCSVGI